MKSFCAAGVVELLHLERKDERKLFRANLKRMKRILRLANEKFNTLGGVEDIICCRTPPTFADNSNYLLSHFMAIMSALRDDNSMLISCFS